MSIDINDLPDSIRGTIYTDSELQFRLGMDVSSFWLAYRSGRIPPAVWLPTEPPIPVWDRSRVDAWISAGCPVEQSHLEHGLQVLPRLMNYSMLGPQPFL